jgi:phosphoribosyl-AMP cyclohydrolase
MDNPFFTSLEKTALDSTVSLKQALEHVRFDDNGLIPAIAQQHDTGEVLMMAWMNRDALLETLEKGQVCYWSRSREALWRKGESSGHTQKLVSLRMDCDGDTLLCFVDQKGPACHSNRKNCFYLEVKDDQLATISVPISE